jgi:tetratricopeptide (TPR) repeat protein
MLVIDHSSSMGEGPGSALDEACKAAINLVQTTPTEFRFAVVEFDHESRQLCPLTGRRRALTRAIRAIRGGGGTDIALGLGTAFNVLSKFHAAHRRCAVLLLSDGESAHEPAIAQANRIKEHDVVMITIGVGAANVGLMRGLATTPEHCYVAQQLDQIAELYTEIGSKMAGARISNVKIEESLNLAKGWVVRGWGELEPVRKDFEKGEFAWLLGTLEDTPILLSYVIEVDCPGWLQIGTKTAHLDAVLINGEKYAADSNQGPYVLVLPRWPGWQLFWLILNPLFFWLFGQFFCRRQALVGPRSARSPTPTATPLPEPLLALPPHETQLALQPSLVIGLGYGGTHAITHCKRLLWERDRADLSAKLRFLAIDTVSSRFFPLPAVGTVALAPDERLELRKPLEHVIWTEADTDRPRYPWLPAKKLLAGGARPDLGRGSGHQRSLGRLALLENRTEVEKKIGSLIKELIALASTNTDGIQVLVAGTTAGGTSSGMVADLGWIVRRKLEEMGQPTAGSSLFLMAPFAVSSIEPHQSEAELRRCNHHALLLELNRIAATGGYRPSPVAGEQGAQRWFDRVFLIGPSRDTAIRDVEELFPKTGEALLCWLGSGAFRSYFKDLDPTAFKIAEEHGVVVGHRFDPNSLYLYPRSVRAWLSRETLYEILNSYLWDARDAPSNRLVLTSRPEETAQDLLDTFLNAAHWSGDLPWLFANLRLMSNENALLKLLKAGGGPGITRGVGALERAELIREQRHLTIASLDTWVSDALNGHIEDGPIASSLLMAVFQALNGLRERLQDVAQLTEALEHQESSLLIINEIAIIRLLIAQANQELASWLDHLGEWGAVWGEGKELNTSNPFEGVMKKMRNALATSHHDLEQAKQYASPRLPLAPTQLKEQIQDRFYRLDASNLMQRLYWKVHRSHSKPTLELQIQSDTTHSFNLDKEPLERMVERISNVILDLLHHFSTGWDKVGIDEFIQNTDLFNLSPPRVDRLSPGAKGVYLYQGSCAPPGRNIEIVPLARVDHREERLVSVEQNVFLSSVWENQSCGRFPPFVQNEEYHAYRAYHTYCNAQNLIPEILDARLVSLFSDPDALIEFVLRGLAGGDLVASQRQGQKVWIDRGAPCGEGYLVPSTGESEKDLLTVAHTWMERTGKQASALGKVIDLRTQIEAHPLIAGGKHSALIAAFVETSLALLELHSYDRPL